MTVGVSVGGTRVGEVDYVHLQSVDVGPGVIANGTRLGDMVTNPPQRSRCWGNAHTHVEARNVSGRSCFLPRNLNSDITETTALGVLGGSWTAGDSAACAVGGLSSVTRTDAGIRLAGWARQPHVPDEAVFVEARVDRHPAGAALADTPRADVGPHGFDFTVPTSATSQAVCATVRGVAGAADVPLGDCHRV